MYFFSASFSCRPSLLLHLQSNAVVVEGGRRRRGRGREREKRGGPCFSPNPPTRQSQRPHRGRETAIFIRRINSATITRCPFLPFDGPLPRPSIYFIGRLSLDVAGPAALRGRAVFCSYGVPTFSLVRRFRVS